MNEGLHRKGTIGLAALAVGAALALLSATSSPQAGVAPRHTMSPALGRIHARPVFVGSQHVRPGADMFSCQSSPIDGSTGPRCYIPQQIQQAYGYSGLLASGVNGSGKSIAIVDAYSDPYLSGDLQIQDDTFGLPAPSLQVVAPQGVPAFDSNNPEMDGWAEEITLDVLWAHAMAPAATIVLVEAKSSQDADILAATKWAVDNGVADVVSQSFGEAESCMDSSLLTQQHAVFQEAVNKGMTLFASSGDSGASQYNCDGSAPLLSVGSPASDPLVTSVGGTTLNASDPAGTYLGETAWTTQDYILCNPPDDNDVNCSGGGFSTIYGKPAYQQAFASGGAGRGVPDVSYNADVNGGLITHCGICNLLGGYDPADPTVFALFGGTSAGSPQWAALTADAEQMAGRLLGDINPVLYALAGNPAAYAADFHDITTGNNFVANLGGTGFVAGTLWDPVTGLGTPNAANLLRALAAPANVSPPAVSGTAAVGQVLTTTTGSWVGSPTGYTYRWQECATDGTGCADIAGATASTYRLAAGQAGHTIRSEVVASNTSGSSVAAASAPTAVVVPVLAATTPPSVSGRALVGRTLTATSGTWNATPASFAYQWLSCKKNGSGCKEIPGATGSTHKLSYADSGHVLKVRVSATNAAGTTAAFSPHTAVVIGKPRLKKQPRITGRPAVGDTLRARKGVWHGPPARYRYQWLRCNAGGGSCTPIKGARHSGYGLTAGDVGHRLRVRVTALNAAGRTTALSRASGVVS